jgi:hypothetical protein
MLATSVRAPVDPSLGIPAETRPKFRRGLTAQHDGGSETFVEFGMDRVPNSTASLRLPRRGDRESADVEGMY